MHLGIVSASPFVASEVYGDIFCDFFFFLFNKQVNISAIIFHPMQDPKKKKKEIKFCIKKMKPIFWDNKDFWNVTF